MTLYPSSVMETRQCPHCAETIKAEANVCRYCGRNVKAQERKTYRWTWLKVITLVPTVLCLIGFIVNRLQDGDQDAAMGLLVGVFFFGSLFGLLNVTSLFGR